MDTERLEVAFPATDSDDAVRQAKAWLKGEARYRLRTIARVRQGEGQMWHVELVVVEVAA
jgi:hypothetical protein